MRVLLDLLEAAKERIAPPVRTNRATAPIWISRAESNPAGGPHLVINCPHCLRNSTQICADTPLTVHETQCLYCKATIHYAMIRPMDGRSSLQNMPGLGPALAA
jgi:hypothetical protein